MSNRAEVKRLLAQLEGLNPNVRDSIWGAMENIKSDYLPKRQEAQFRGRPMGYRLEVIGERI